MSTSTSSSSTAPNSSSNSQKPLKHRSVVSSFIFKLPPSYLTSSPSSSFSSSAKFNSKDSSTCIQKPLVALFKRSNKVSTYTHHHAPISGSIEPTDPSPLSAAWREIHEETTLTASDLELLRQGKPYTFSDESVGREWTIWPFAYVLKDKEGSGVEKRIKIDWEHEGWGWFDPLDVQDTQEFGGVPRLKESLRRVWFEIDLGPEAGKVLAEGCKRLEDDRVSGARQMAGDALRILRHVIDKMDDGVFDATDGNGKEAKWWKDVRMAAWHLWKNGRESMGAAIMSALLSALAAIEAEVFQGHSKDCGKQLKPTIVSVLDREIPARSSTNDQISQSFAVYVSHHLSSLIECQKPLSILTLSESSTITHALSHLPVLLPNLTLDIRILESRPLLEGISLAASLAKALSTDSASSNNRQHSITVYTDASASLATQGVQLVVIGADRIASDGSVSNKTGSLSTVLATRHNTKGAKVVVVCDSEKVALPGPPEQHVVEDQGLEQVTRAWMGEGSSERIRGAARTLLNFADATRTDMEGQKEAQRHEAKEKTRVKVEVRNVSFEWCPGGFIDAYVTEEGEWNDENVKRKSEALQELEKRLFGPL
ncbi:hypothetical protein QBC32DRAFT_355395 [Pseudoneurospora amorphoporcata]|uniref:Nudix hydrolase domain-containing protein n=1 Tax=Pseudoneurospora amorphoporcata TaxID=241081 RepID=A0AAN6NKA2_9PEZI|nr:hypothetical protein QBC32DRAFT_355395 [Pseudoneurospora amorphoporcata]